MDTTVKTHITNLIIQQIRNAEITKNTVSEHSYRNLLRTVNLFSEEQAKAFLTGMEFQKDLPDTFQFGSF